MRASRQRTRKPRGRVAARSMIDLLRALPRHACKCEIYGLIGRQGARNDDARTLECGSMNRCDQRNQVSHGENLRENSSI